MEASASTANEEASAIRTFLKCRTIGLPIAHSRLLGHHVVKSTRPCILVSPNFVPMDSFCAPREEGHLNSHPDYPHPRLPGGATVTLTPHSHLFALCPVASPLVQAVPQCDAEVLLSTPQLASLKERFPSHEYLVKACGRD